MGFRPLDGAFTSILAGTVCTEKAQSHMSRNQQRFKEWGEKDGHNGLKKSQLFAWVINGWEFCIHTLSVFLGCSAIVFKFIVSCA